MNERVEKIRRFALEKMFFDASFESSRRNELLAEVNVSPGKTVLTREQEYQIFRKYNYLKYRFMKLTAGFGVSSENPSPKPCPPVNLERIGEKSISNLERLMGEITATRNKIFEANTRLVFKPVSRHAPSDSFDRDEFVSNAYVHVIKSIDCFDYRRGFKFSTYCVNVLITNLGRDKEKLRRAQAPLEFSDLISFSPCKEESFPHSDQEYNSQMVENVFQTIRKSMRNPEDKIKILKGCYGIDSEPLLLREIAEKMNLSRQRIKQIKTETMAVARRLSYEP
jgi:RNA polymerase sigma factor (sigma-70 family)